MSTAPETRKTGFIWKEIFRFHDQGSILGHEPARVNFKLKQFFQVTQHFENPETKARLYSLLDASGLLSKLHRIDDIPMATDEQLQYFHTSDYIQKVQAMNDRDGGDAGDVARFSHGGADIARLAVGACVAAVDAVMKGEVKNAYCLVRPPGHHAERDRGMGFCLFGNVAIAAMHAQKVHGVKRIAIVDWDVHHGNGTQQAFYDRDDILFVSLHQDSLYPPGTGQVTEIGSGKGEGYNINIPLPPGTGIGGYEAAFDRVVVPALRTFQPELILVSSGFDAAAFDPLSHMMLNAPTFQNFTRKLMQVAAELGHGRLVICHEGGYSAEIVPFCGLRVIEALSGIETGAVDPFETEIVSYGYQALQSHQDAVITAAEKVLVKIAPPKL